MAQIDFHSLPEVLKSIRLQPLFVLQLDVNPPLKIGETPDGNRRVGVVTGGTFKGEKLAGKVLDGGSDWQFLRPDGATTLDVRLTLETDDGELIGMTYQGLRHGPSEVIQKINSGLRVDPASYYFRINPVFSTASVKYSWLNRIITIGTGHRNPDGPVYSIFEAL